jgi:hypothetical protein
MSDYTIVNPWSSFDASNSNIIALQHDDEYQAILVAVNSKEDIDPDFTRADVAETIAAAWTFSSLITANLGITSAGGPVTLTNNNLIVTAGDIDVVAGDIDIQTGTLDVANLITVAAGGINATGDSVMTGSLSVDNILINSSSVTSTSGHLNLTANSGNVVIEGTVAINLGVITGVTNITSTLFTGNLSGNVTGNVTGDITGNAGSADVWSTPRNFSVSGDATGTDAAEDGSSNITIPITLSSNSVDTTQLVNDAVTLAKMDAAADGALITYNTSGNPVNLAPGTSGQLLETRGAGQLPVWSSPVITTRATIDSPPYLGITGGGNTLVDLPGCSFTAEDDTAYKVSGQIVYWYPVSGSDSEGFKWDIEMSTLGFSNWNWWWNSFGSDTTGRLPDAAVSARTDSTDLYGVYSNRGVITFTGALFNDSGGPVTVQLRASKTNSVQSLRKPSIEYDTWIDWTELIYV